MFDDRKTVLTHFNGLEEIIRRRGGLETFRSNPVLRTVIFWCVLVYSCTSYYSNAKSLIGSMSKPHFCTIVSHDSQSRSTSGFELMRYLRALLLTGPSKMLATQMI
jgi:hypothetical protein